MKNIYRLFTVTLVALIFALNAFTQKAFCSGHEITVNASDSVVIRLNDYEGTIQWQKSFDNNKWENISGAIYDTLLFISDATTYFRAEVIVGFCDPFFSDIVKVIVITEQPDQGVIDIDGNFYPSVIIGNQEWMAENLKTTKYRNGTLIEYPGSNNSAWTNNTTGAYAWYDNIPTWKDKYGALYNWYAIKNNHDLCPMGWHVPNDAEWTILLNYLNSNGYPNTDVASGAGNALKSCRQVNSPLGGDCITSEHPRWNTSSSYYGFDQFGFSALPGASRDSDGRFGGEGGYSALGEWGEWWSSTDFLGNLLASSWEILAYKGMLRNKFSTRTVGKSVRCLRYIGSTPPSLSTLPVSEITEYTAVSGGDITDDGGSAIIERGVVWGTSQNPTIESNEGITHDGAGGGSFSSHLTELTPRTIYYVRAYATNNYFTSYGSQMVFVALSETEIVFGNGITDIDDNFYPSIIIGNQEWMSENLKTTLYRDGTPIEYPGANNEGFGSNITGAYAWYDNDIIWKDTYGALYNWYAVNNSSGLCPVGWHVPDHNDWTQLEQFVCNQLGNENCETQFPYDNTTGSLGTIEGTALKSCLQFFSPFGGDCDTSEHPRWDMHPTHYGTDEFGLSAFPGGFRHVSGAYDFIGLYGYWWSSAESSSTRAWYRTLRYNNGNVTRSFVLKGNGLSVRCVRDSDIPTLTTTPVSDITFTSAVSGGNVSDDGGAQVLARGMVWSKTPNPTIENNDGYTSDGSGLGEFISNLNDLTFGTTYYLRAYATNSAGTAYGQLEEFSTDDIGDNIQPGEGVTDIEGNFYTSVIIGNQEWMAENLKTTKYRNGTLIDFPGFFDLSWQNNITGAYAWYGGNTVLKNSYGALYNWYAVNNINGLCPAGWYVPSDAEWTELVNYVVSQGYINESNNPNGAGNALKSCRQVSSPVGGNCSTSEHPRWNSHSTHYGTDEFGFSGLPGGYRDIYGAYVSLGDYGYWWSSTESSTTFVWGRYMGFDYGNVYRSGINKNGGFSVRCVRDSDISISIPILTTTPVDFITSTSAVSGGNISDDGWAPVTARGAVWSTTPNPTIENNVGYTSDGSGLGEFISNLTGLTPETTYYVRAYATNSAGTGYGQQESFSTEPSGMNGSFNNPFTVAYAIANNEGSGVWVQGYITGVMETNVNPFEPNFVAPFSTSTNIIIADSPGESNLGNSLIIQLPAGAVREALNLVNNPGNKGKQVKLLGDLDAYFSQPGMRNTYGYWLDGEGIVPPVSFFEETFPSNLGSFTPYNILGDQEWVHATFDGGCAYMSGFYDGTSHPNEDWLISPAIDLSGRNNVNLQIRETINFLTSYADLKVLVSNNYTGGNPNENGTWTELSGFNRPPGNNWVFVDSGNINLSSYDGQTIRIAFKYLSSSAGSSVWQVSRVILSEIF